VTPAHPDGGAGDGTLCVVYDGECPFCRGAARVGRVADRRGATRWVPAADVARHGVPPHPDAARSVLVWAGGATPLTGVPALAAVAGTWPVVGRPLAALLRATGAPGERAYAWIARNRYRLRGRRHRGARPPARPSS